MNNTFIATLWSIFDRIGTQLVSFLIGIALARLLNPEDFGLVGISMIFIAFANVFIECGISNALIRKVDRTNEDLSTAFFFNLIMGLLMFTILFVSAPFVAVFFESEQLVGLVRVVSIMLLTNSLCIVQNAILTSQLKIKIQTYINFSAIIPSGAVAIFLAYNGYGIYAIAVQSVLGSVIRTITLWIVTKWKPILTFSRKSIQYLWYFGSKLIAANILGTLFNEFYAIIIGKFIGKIDLGLYSKARSLANQPDTICCGVIQKIVIPVFSKYQYDYVLLREKYRESIKLIYLIMGLVTAILLSVSNQLIIILWGDKWIGAIFPFQMLIISSLFSPVSTLNLSLLQVINHTGYSLKLEFIKKPMFIVLIILGAYFKLPGLLFAQIAISILAVVVNMKATRKFLKYPYSHQVKDIYIYIIAIVPAVILGLLSQCSTLNIILQLIIGLTLSSFSYISFLFLMKEQMILIVYNRIVVNLKKYYGYEK